MQPSPRFTHPVSIAAAALLALALLVAIALMIPGVSSAGTEAVTLSANSRARVNSCVSDYTYEKRKIEFSGRMQALGGTRAGSKMQMRFDVLRKYNESKKWRLLRAAGLSEWLGSTEPGATVYVRNIALAQVETAAQYKSRIRYRWVDADGKVVAKKLRTTKPCKQRAPLPDPGVLNVTKYQLPGQPNAAYVVRVYNFSKSEALSVPVFVSIDGAAGETQTIDSIAGKEIVDLTFNGNACTREIAVRLNPLNTVREPKLTKNNDSVQAC